VECAPERFSATSIIVPKLLKEKAAALAHSAAILKQVAAAVALGGIAANLALSAPKSVA
jgi:hypothetical protein